MKLARLFIPKYPNYQVKMLEDRLLEAFDGYTQYSLGIGVWKNPETKQVIQEPVYVYDVVIEDEDDAALRAILEEYKVEATQQSILYILNNEPNFF